MNFYEIWSFVEIWSFEEIWIWSFEFFFFFIFRLVVLNKACIPNLGFLFGLEHTFSGGRPDGRLAKLRIKLLSPAWAGAWAELGKSDQIDQIDKGNKSDQSDQIDQLDQSDQINQIDQIEEIWRFEEILSFDV